MTLIFMTHADRGGCSSTDLLPILLVSTTAYTNFKLGASKPKEEGGQHSGWLPRKKKKEALENPDRSSSDPLSDKPSSCSALLTTD
jgi:hypothetical protein